VQENESEELVCNHGEIGCEVVMRVVDLPCNLSS
jgi:hypothetical protein